MLDGKRSEAPLWEIGIAYDRKCRLCRLMRLSKKRVSYQVVADYASYQAISRIATPIEGRKPDSYGADFVGDSHKFLKSQRLKASKIIFNPQHYNI